MMYVAFDMDESSESWAFPCPQKIKKLQINAFLIIDQINSDILDTTEKKGTIRIWSIRI